MKQAVARRKSYRGVIAGLERQLSAELTTPQRKEFTYLLSRAQEAEHNRAKLRRTYRSRVRAARRVNR